LSLTKTEDYHSCFGCGKENPIGLKLVFKWDGHTARAEFTPSDWYQGWPGILHGGIMACILDEAMGYAALFEAGHCVTALMQIKLKQTVNIGDTLIITSSVRKKTRKLVDTEAVVALLDGTILAESSGTHYIVNNNLGLG
jgi:acyl-coenzyme A thioesterase PaaI-like protein